MRSEKQGRRGSGIDQGLEIPAKCLHGKGKRQISEVEEKVSKILPEQAGKQGQCWLRSGEAVELVLRLEKVG